MPVAAGTAGGWQVAGRAGLPLAERGVAGTDLFGLWDLTAPAGEALVGGAAAGPLGDGGEVVLRGIAVAAGEGHQGLERRLVCGVADSWRARGAARLVARPADGARSRRSALLRSAARPDRVPADDEASWWELEL